MNDLFVISIGIRLLNERTKKALLKIVLFVLDIYFAFITNSIINHQN